jgi:hypothetical protein
MSSSGFAARAQSAGDKNDNGSRSNDSKSTSNQDDSVSPENKVGGD